MSTLLEQANRLDHLVAVIQDVTGAGQTAAALTELDQHVAGLARDIKAGCAVLDEDALPAGGGIDRRRIDVVARGSDKVAERVEKNPGTVNAGSTWSKLQTAAKALVGDLRKLGIDRWRELVDAEPVPELAELLDSLVPGAPGSAEFKQSVARLNEWREKSKPDPGDAAKVNALLSAIREARANLERHAVPEEISVEYAELVHGTLPLAQFKGPIEEFVNGLGLEKRIRVRLDQGEDG